MKASTSSTSTYILQKPRPTITLFFISYITRFIKLAIPLQFKNLWKSEVFCFKRKRVDSWQSLKLCIKVFSVCHFNYERCLLIHSNGRYAIVVCKYFYLITYSFVIFKDHFRLYKIHEMREIVGVVHIETNTLKDCTQKTNPHKENENHRKSQLMSRPK